MADLKKGRNGAKLIEKQAATLAAFYAAASDRMIADIKRSSATLFQRKRANEMLVRIDDVIKKLDKRTKEYLDKQVPKTYAIFANEARKALRKDGLVMGKKFSKIHKEATKALADEGKLRFAVAMQGIKRSATDYVALARKTAIRESIAVGQITGQAAEKTAREVKKLIKDQGITSLIDRGGKKWELSRYADMLTRQLLSQTSRDAGFNMAIEFGHDVVKVSSHNSRHDVCAKWEGKRLSITGKTKGLPTVEEATAAGLFHVGCMHVTFVDIS